jgi:hypothetical protein
MLDQFEEVHMYHVNSIEDAWPIDTRRLRGPMDLMLCEPWIPEFIASWPKAYGYYNENAHIWFRKVAAVAHAIKQCDTDYLIWSDCDMMILQPFGNAFMDHCAKASIAVWERSEKRAIASGLIVFNLRKRGREYAGRWLDAYMSRAVFRWERWDDGGVLTHLTRTEEWDRVFLTRKYNAPFNLSDYIEHPSNSYLRTIRTVPVEQEFYEGGAPGLHRQRGYKGSDE